MFDVKHITNPAQGMRPYGFEDFTDEAPTRVVCGMRTERGYIKQLRRVRYVLDVFPQAGDFFGQRRGEFRANTLTASATSANVVFAEASFDSDFNAVPALFLVDTAWSFDDRGFIDGGQDGAFRQYTETDSVSASPWTVLADGGDGQTLSLRLDFEPDGNCSFGGDGYNFYTQEANAELTITTTKVVQMSISWEGLGETEDPGGTTQQIFEEMTLHVNGSFIARAHAPGGGLGCAGGDAPVVSDPPSPYVVDLAAGTHVIAIRANTNDQAFHQNAYYQFNIQFFDL